MTDAPGASDAPSPQQQLAVLALERRDRVAVAVSHTIGVERAVELAERISARLDHAGVPPPRRSWIVANPDGGDWSAAAAVLGALSDLVGSARLTLHDPRDPDALIFQRRPPDQQRGGVFLNAAWMQASVRIACGPPAELAAGLCGWFNSPAALDPERDLDAALLL